MTTAAHHCLLEQLDQHGLAIVLNELDKVTIDRFKALIDVARSADNAENVTNSSNEPPALSARFRPEACF